MQRGIGRTGYFLLALVLFGVGAFGAALAWFAFEADTTSFFWMGLGVIGTALAGLFLFASFSLANVAEARPAPTPASPAPAPVTSTPTSAMDYEFDAYEPAAKAAPEHLIVPEAFQEPVEFKQAARPTPVAPAAPVTRSDPAAWPQSKGKSAWTRQVEHRRGVEAEMDDSRRRDLTTKYTQTTPMLRSILEKESARPLPPEPQAPTAPTVPSGPEARDHIADRAPRDMNTDFVAPGMSVGQCGQCRTLLLAPEERPLRLKCPECAKVTLLQ